MVKSDIVGLVDSTCSTCEWVGDDQIDGHTHTDNKIIIRYRYGTLGD